MWMKRLLIIMLATLICGTAFAADSGELQVRATKAGVNVNIDRVVKDGRVVASASDAGKNPVFGLDAGDFAVTQSGRTADIISVQPISESLDVPRNIVLVLDNSYSMQERRAIYSLLTGVDALLKIVRPIDRVQVVVFENFDKVKMGGYELSVATFSSNERLKLDEFAARSYGADEITGKTVLKDAILAGLELIKGMPESEPRFMVVFSDGEDLNSVYNRDDVMKSAQNIKGFNAFAIDYMPDSGTDEFLTEFTAKYHGQTWKAKSDNDLVRIFEEVASKMQYYYVVSYQFPPTGSLSVSPTTMSFDEMRIAGASPVTSIDMSTLTLKPVVDTVYGIAYWKSAVTNNKGRVAVLTGVGAPGSEVKFQLPVSDPQSLATGGELKVSMELVDNNGQKLALTAPPVKVDVIKTTASLTVSPAVLKFDEVSVSGGEPVTSVDASALTLMPVVSSAHGIKSWKASVSNTAGNVAAIAGDGAPAEKITVPLSPGNLRSLAAGGELTASMELNDMKGHNIALSAQPVKVEIAKTTADMTVVPDTVTIEEIRTIDSSPMLGHIYFDKMSSDIAERYVRLAGPAETEGFSEQNFRDTLEKYYQVLNVVGKRLSDNPSATITLVGCNDNTSKEKKNMKLSAKRAETVRDYLQAVWNIATERIAVESRNLPEMPSTSRIEEGQAENRRVEIRSDDPAIIDPIQSTYLSNRIDTPELGVNPAVASPHGIADWKVSASNNMGSLAELSGAELPAGSIGIPLANKDLAGLATGGDIAVKMELNDKKGHNMPLGPAPVKVNFIKTSQRLAKKEGLSVQEKYALILFDFDKDTIGAQNQIIVNRIVERTKSLPQATMSIVGHTDNIGKDAYNIKLSERRALAAYKLLKAAYEEDPGERIGHSGVGPNNPLYDNSTPEARSFNRTVTITLEYTSAE